MKNKLQHLVMSSYILSKILYNNIGTKYLGNSTNFKVECKTYNMHRASLHGIIYRAENSS